MKFVEVLIVGKHSDIFDEGLFSRHQKATDFSSVHLGIAVNTGEVPNTETAHQLY